MSDKKQSSVEWLVHNLNGVDCGVSYDYFKSIIEQAKAMHNEEIIESYCQGCLDMSNDDTIFPRETSEQYYNETFGGNNEK